MPAMAFPDGIADFRSDTVTRPTDEMREAMAVAAVGDDVYGEDPTVNALETESAALLGKEAAVFVPSGTMGNQLALAIHTRPGQEVICAESAHIRDYEHGAAGALWGVSMRPVHTPNGEMTVAEIATMLDRMAYHRPPIALLAWENTHNVSGGTTVPIEMMEAGSALARDHGLAVHLDGARIWNAVAASGVPATRYAATADTVMFCFSKGLGGPVGSVLAGSAASVSTARLWRERLGGAMRQVGIVAAGAAIALRDRGRLADDHVVARELGEGLAERYPAAVAPVETNMVLVDEVGLPWTAAELRDALDAVGVRVGLIRPGVLRFCTHRDVDRADVARVLDIVDGMERPR
jgi:threonine aldolase